MITQKEMEENMRNLEAPGFPTADELIEYSESGQDKKNALEYEKAYHALIEQVKDKPHDEQVAFLMSHMNELRNMVDLFSYARDMYMFPSSYYDEVLANLMIYRYENNISILDDEYCVTSKPALRKIKSDIFMRRGHQLAEQERQFAKDHPEEYKKQCEKRTQKYKKIAEKMLLVNKKIAEKYTFEELMNYDGSNWEDFYKDET
jgi:hypothetical protein